MVDVERTGVSPETLTDADAEMFISANDGLVVVEVYNPTGGALSVSASPTAQVGGMDLADVTVSVPAGATRWIGPWPPAVFNETDGSVTFSAATGLKLRGLRI